MKRISAVLMALVVLLLAGCYQEGNYLIVRTADPHLAIAIELLPSPLAPVDEPEVVPAEETGVEEQIPPEIPPALIKGNISTRTGEKIYHVPGQPNYDSVLIDEAKGEQWFTTEEEAQAAGWRKAAN